MRPFLGAKIMLFLGPHMVILRRDHAPGLVWPGLLDFPGGGREGGESPEACVLRETHEEVGLRLAQDDLRVVRVWQMGQARNWFFAAHLPVARTAEIRFGGEGAGWLMMPPDAYLTAPDAIPHFAEILRDYVKKTGWQNHPAQ